MARVLKIRPVDLPTELDDPPPPYLSWLEHNEREGERQGSREEEQLLGAPNPPGYDRLVNRPRNEQDLGPISDPPGQDLTHVGPEKLPYRFGLGWIRIFGPPKNATIALGMLTRWLFRVKAKESIFCLVWQDEYLAEELKEFVLAELDKESIFGPLSNGQLFVPIGDLFRMSGQGENLFSGYRPSFLSDRYGFAS